MKYRMSCPTEERLADIPVDDDGRVVYGTMEDAKVRLMLRKGTDVNDLMSRIYEEYEEVLYWATNRYQ